ncbi:prolyl-tRNA synthetase associated domain-containing protein [candidate division KSB1 bacterium]|nr:MAG: prolyl-tRNA synthetase associated domain-containing protein [candidate division KSB1 bacterium]
MEFSDNEQKVYDILDKLNITYERYEHPPVYTVEQAEQHWKNIKGAHCKNIFLRNKKGSRHYLIVLEHLKKLDIKTLAKRLGEDKFSFASAERLQRYLGLETGAVSPFGLINDSKKEVKVIIDSDLKKRKIINFHPNVNTATVGISFNDFQKFLNWCGNKFQYLQF